MTRRTARRLLAIGVVVLVVGVIVELWFVMNGELKFIQLVPALVGLSFAVVALVAIWLSLRHLPD